MVIEGTKLSRIVVALLGLLMSCPGRANVDDNGQKEVGDIGVY